MRCCLSAPVVKFLSLGSISRRGFSISRLSLIATPHVEVDTEAEAYQRMAHELTLLSTEEFSHRLHRFSRTNFDPSHVAAVHAHVSELLNRRLHEVTFKCAREYAHLAHVAKLHELCLALYYARANIMSTASLTDGDNDTAGSFAVSEAVVDSAYSISSTADLVRLATFCVKHLKHVPPLGWEVMSSFSLVRAFWRCICIASSHENQHGVEAKQALQDASHIYEQCMALVCPDPCKEVSTQNAIRTAQRFLRYASSGDKGEMLFFRFCLQRGFLRRPRDAKQPNGDEGELDTRAPTTNLGSSGGERISEEQWFYASLIATCRVGHHVDVALRYFDDIGSFLGVGQVSCDDLLRPQMRKMQCGGDAMKESVGEQLAHANSMDGVSEFLVFQLLTVLHAAKDNRKIVFTARSMLRDGARLSISVWSIVLIAAGETKAVDLALAAFTQARNSLLDGDHVADRRGNEYLLQTAIHALSKCQIPRFEEDYLQPCQEQKLMHCTNEFYFSTLLQHAHNSTDPAAGAEYVLNAMREKGSPLTARIVSKLMKIYLRVESPRLLTLYQNATQQLGIFKPSWLEELLLWADRRRYNLTCDERKFIVDEVRRVHGAGGAGGDLGGLRTQYALLRYDYEHNPREVFLSTLNPPKTEPTILDSRVHFLLKRPHCVDHQRASANFSHTSATPIIVGDPAKRQRFARRSLLTGDEESAKLNQVHPEEFRIYMSKILESIQNHDGCK